MSPEKVLYLGSDDSETERCIRSLRRAGFSISRASGLGEAIAACRLGSDPIVVLGLREPVGMRREALQRLVGAGASVVLIADASGDDRAGGTAGVERLVRRGPALLSDLARALREVGEVRRLRSDCEVARSAVARLSRGGAGDASPLLSEEIIGAIGHELRNPIAALLGYSEVLAEGDGLDEESTEIATRIEANAASVLDLIGDLLDALRVQNGTLALIRTSTNFNHLIEGVLRSRWPRPTGKRKRIVFTPASLLPTVMVDRERIARMVSRLLRIGIDAVPDGGRVRLATASEGSHVRLRIELTGPGGRVASEGATTRATGLTNWFLCRAIVAAHGGQVALDNAPRLRVSLSLPLTEPRVASQR
jgi:signal transduction histidine kinase